MMNDYHIKVEKQEKSEIRIEEMKINFWETYKKK